MYLELESLIVTDVSAAAITSLINATKAVLPNCLIGTYFLPATDFGAVSGGRQASIEALNDSLATAIAAADWLGPDFYQVAWTPPPGNEEWEWNVNECLRVQAGKPMAPFLTTSHATGGGLVTSSQFRSIVRALHARDIRELTLWNNVTTADDGEDFVEQIPVLGAAIFSYWGESRTLGLGAGAMLLPIGVAIGP